MNRARLLLIALAYLIAATAPSFAADDVPRLGKYVILSYGRTGTPPLRLGEFELLAGGKYRFYANGGKLLGEGRYSYDAGAKSVKWIDGQLKENGWSGDFTIEREGKTHKIRLNRVTTGTNSTDAK